jgi:hypothetical protein
MGGLVQRRARNCRCQRGIVDGVTNSPRRRRTGSSRASAAIIWCRRRRISISLVVSDLILRTVQASSLENRR